MKEPGSSDLQSCDPLILCKILKEPFMFVSPLTAWRATLSARRRSLSPTRPLATSLPSIAIATAPSRAPVTPTAQPPSAGPREPCTHTHRYSSSSLKVAPGNLSINVSRAFRALKRILLSFESFSLRTFNQGRTLGATIPGPLVQLDTLVTPRLMSRLTGTVRRSTSSGVFTQVLSPNLRVHVHSI